jgi:predicted phosphoribosyltransferase
MDLLLGIRPLFAGRAEAGRELAAALEAERGSELTVVGLARGGVAVAAEVASALGAPLDVMAVRKIGHPWQPEYAIGAVTPGDAVYVRGRDGLTDEQVAAAVEAARTRAAALDQILHAEHPALDLHGKTALVVDDGLATGASMFAALRWCRAAGAARRVAAAPVASLDSLGIVRAEADEVICLHAPAQFFAVSVWYEEFPAVEFDDVVQLVDANRRHARERVR